MGGSCHPDTLLPKGTAVLGCYVLVLQTGLVVGFGARSTDLSGLLPADYPLRTFQAGEEALRAERCRAGHV